jgi:hypothetical protein
VSGVTNSVMDCGLRKSIFVKRPLGREARDTSGEPTLTKWWGSEDQ